MAKRISVTEVPLERVNSVECKPSIALKKKEIEHHGRQKSIDA